MLSVSSSPESKRPRRGAGCIGSILALLVLYYGAQILLRSALPARMQVVAHRGGPAAAPENTLAAFRGAIELGVDWLEFDVQMTQDGALVVLHDETVDRTTDGTGAVSDLTLDEIRALDAGDGEQVPTFQDVLELAKASGVNILPEAKSAHVYPGLEAKMLEALAAADYLDHAVIQSFEADSLKKFRQLKPPTRLCALSGLWTFSLSDPPADAEFVCPMAEMVLLNPYMIRQAHDDGRQVFAYFGVLEHPFMSQLLRFFGADGIIVDHPGLVMQTFQ